MEVSHLHSSFFRGTAFQKNKNEKYNMNPVLDIASMQKTSKPRRGGGHARIGQTESGRCSRWQSEEDATVHVRAQGDDPKA